MRLKTRIFELSGRYYKSLPKLAQVMGISVSQVYRVQEGKRNINQKFIIGAMRAFPGYKFDDLFYFDSTSPTPANKHIIDKKQGKRSTEPALGKLSSTAKI